MVTEVPPAAGPVVGVMEVTVGGGGGGGGSAVGHAVELKVLPASWAVNLSPVPRTLVRPPVQLPLLTPLPWANATKFQAAPPPTQ